MLLRIRARLLAHFVLVYDCLEPFRPKGQDELKEAVAAWNRSKVSAEKKYGQIATWITTDVNKMVSLFSGMSDFNDAIGTWDTRNVESMKNMFDGASAFNQDLNGWNVANVEQMQGMFRHASAFNGQIAKWNTNNIRYFSAMFEQASAFNQRIDDWRTPRVKFANFMFQGASTFNQPLSSWSTDNVKQLKHAFASAASFSQDINSWNTAGIKELSDVFAYASNFDQKLDNWNTRGVTDMRNTFQHALVFNQYIGSWCIGSVNIMFQMFESALKFNQAIGEWCTGGVSTMTAIFRNASAFNQPIGSWNTANLEDVREIFKAATVFNQAIGQWCTGKITDMRYTFSDASSFNQDLGNWSTGRVTEMDAVFFGASVFNGEVGGWDTSSATSMIRMFCHAFTFNRNINTWNVGMVKEMRRMFHGDYAFNQPLRSWDTRNVTNMRRMFEQAFNFRQDIHSWETPSIQTMYHMDMYSPLLLCKLDPISSYLPNSCPLCICVLLVCWYVVGGWKSLSHLQQRRLSYFWLRSRSMLDEAVSLPKVNFQSRDPFKVGRELHLKVGPERWAITREDLDLFEHEVRIAWRNGRIPNGTGKFANPFHDDPMVGPTVFQVSEFFIKAVTANYGGMSFALMLHPHGLPCDCVATHALAGGIFEFCDKLRRRWPRQCKHMYIGFLAHPQNPLDIADLFDVSIDRSPFAKALSCSSHMVVVPNRALSIYTRLWCCFETYIACLLNKTIILPRARTFVKWVYWRFAFCVLVTAIAIGLSDFILVHSFGTQLRRSVEYHDALLCEETAPHTESEKAYFRDLRAQAEANVVDLSNKWLIVMITWDLLLGILLGLLIYRPSAAERSVATLIGNIAASGTSGVHMDICVSLYDMFATDPSSRWGARLFAVYLWSAAAFGLCFIMCAVHILECRTEKARQEEANELSYTDLTGAECSDEADKSQILKELAGRETQVDEAIKTLIKQGMSTRELRTWGKENLAAGHLHHGLNAFALLAWPLYAAFLWAGNWHFDRIDVLASASVVTLIIVLWWAVLCFEPDLANVVIRGGIIALVVMLLCGDVLGIFGIAAGCACAACYVADKRKQVRREELHRFIEFMQPLTIISLGYLTYETFSLLVFGTCCVFPWQEFICMMVFAMLWAGLIRVTCRLQNQASESWVSIFVGVAIMNCFLVAGSMYVVSQDNFFLAQEKEFHEFLPLLYHWYWGISFLVCLGMLSPLWLLYRERARRRSHNTRRMARGDIELEMTLFLQGHGYNAEV